MGFGDEIMAAGEAVRAQVRDPRPVAILDRRGRPRWHAVWEGNPRIARPDQVAAGLDVQCIVNGPGCRPYVARYSKERWVFTDWRAHPGEIYLSAAERAFAAPYAGGVVIEPHIKAAASPNKDWGWARWQRLVELRPDLEWWQLGPAGTQWLEGVRPIVTPEGPGGFRQACAVLARARAAVLPEGGLHHAAAALGVPAVVIFGGFISPANTGYDAHINLYRPHPPSLSELRRTGPPSLSELRRTGPPSPSLRFGYGSAGPPPPCGLRVPCAGCAEAMAAITPEKVAERLEELLCSSAKASICRTASGT